MVQLASICDSLLFYWTHIKAVVATIIPNCASGGIALNVLYFKYNIFNDEWSCLFCFNNIVILNFFVYALIPSLNFIHRKIESVTNESTLPIPPGFHFLSGKRKWLSSKPSESDFILLLVAKRKICANIISNSPSNFLFCSNVELASMYGPALTGFLRSIN